MIQGFEKETAELNEYELNVLVPIVARGLNSHIGKTKEVTSAHICRRLTSAGYIISPARLRKVINYIRNNGIVKCLIATSQGYYIATSKAELDKFVSSLKGRGDAIYAVANAMYQQGLAMFRE